MAQTLAVAKHLDDLNKKKHHSAMDQMEMHKMMYFSLRESVMGSEDAPPLFDGTFEAWKSGPVLLEVREEYLTGHMFSGDYGTLTEKETTLVDSVFNRYDKYDAWTLSLLSHCEYSWLNARKGLRPGDPCKEKMRLSAIRVDAVREKARRRGVVLRTLY